MKNSERAEIHRRIETAAYKQIPGGFRHLFSPFFEGGEWWVFDYETCFVWSVGSESIRKATSPLRFKRLPPDQQEEGAKRYVRTLKSPYSVRRTLTYQIEVAGYGQIRGSEGMNFRAAREGGKWFLVDEYSDAVWAVTRVSSRGSRSGFRFRNVDRGEL